MKRIFAIILSLLMLVSNIGFSMNTHFCGGKAVKTSFSLGLHNPDCGMSVKDMECETVPSKDDQFTQKPCCENHHEVIQLEENADIQSFQFKANPVIIVAFVHAFVQPLFFADQKFIHYTDYSPPIPDKDTQVLFQCFLI